VKDTKAQMRRLTVAHQKQGECTYCDEKFAEVWRHAVAMYALGHDRGWRSGWGQAHHFILGRDS
jgi:hypothetical protein